jgi:Zn-dependent peptidase ImmA (M78 family)
METEAMAVIRRKRFSDAQEQLTSPVDLIDSADKLLAFAERAKLPNCPLDVSALANALGIDIRYNKLDDDLSGILRLNDDTKKWEMVVNSTHHSNRQRYTIAHELAHFCLHRYGVTEFKDRIFFRATPSNRMEWEANEFAGQILMPEDDFRKLVHQGVTSVDALADKFGVSSLALRIRAKQLGFSGHGL